MIPLCDLVPSRTRPIATLGLVVASARRVVVLWALLAGSSTPLARLGFAPATWTWTGIVVTLSMHADLTAAIASLLALWLFGPAVEDRLGHGRFLVLWAAGGLAAAAAQIAVAPHATAMFLGGVGATAGVVAGNLALHPRGRLLAVTPVVFGFEFVDLPSWLYAAVWLSVLPLATLMPLATLGATCAAGAAVGAAVAAVARRPERMRIEWWGP